MMKKMTFVLVCALLAFHIQDTMAQGESKSETVCYAGDPFRTDRAFDRCDDFCTENGYRGAVGWKCGSDIKCQGSRCVCICRKTHYDKDRREREEDKDKATIKIPLGDMLNLELK